mgnify:CR=1 FL=1
MEFKKVTREWDTLKKDAMERAKNAAPLVKEGKIVDAKDTVALLEAVIKPYDKVNIEGNNQKQADFLAKCLCQVDPAKIHDLHMVQSVLTLPEHLDVFEKGIAKKAGYVFLRSAGWPYCPIPAGRQTGAWRYPHLSGIIWPLFPGPDPACCSRCSYYG